MSIPTFTLNVAGVNYTAAQRAAAGIHMGSLELNLEASYDQLSFTEVGPKADPLFHPGQSVTLTRDSDSLVCFNGEITDLQWTPIPKGLGKAYTCLGLMYLGDRVPVTWTDGTGTIVLNREPQDPYYTPSLAGLTVGEIIALALTVDFTAGLFDAVGIGNYTSLSPPTLPATTVADLAGMTAVPANTVTLQGESLLNQLGQFAQTWMPRFVMQLRPDGLIRFKDTTDIGVSATFIPRTMMLPGTTGVGDTGVNWPTISASTRNCSTSVVIRGGPETEAAWLTLLDGTLIEGWSGGDESSWTLEDFTQPKDAYDEGTITAITSTSATVQSDDPGVFWAINFWNGREANILMTDLVASGISQQEQRIVTTNTAMVAGGTSTIGWDSSWPVTMTTYTRYRLVGTSGGLNEVGRLFYCCDPSTGDFGTNCYIGAHMVVRSAVAIRVANNDKTFAEYYSSTATICNSSSGSPPFVELPMVAEPVPILGAYRFTQPTAAAFATQATLEAGYPATSADGRPSEIRILSVYSRGPLTNQAPGSGFSGTAYTTYGLEVTKYSDFPDWIWKQDTTSFGGLANEYLLSVQDIVWEGSVSVYEFPVAFDVLIFENAINFDMNGGTCPWTAMDAPQRSVKVDWGNGAEAVHFISLSFSSRRRAFSAESLYLHPQFAPGSPLFDVTSALSSMGRNGIFATGAAGPGITSPLLGEGAAINGGPAMALGQPASQVALSNALSNQRVGMSDNAVAGMTGLAQQQMDAMTGGMASGGVNPGIGMDMGGPTAQGSVSRGGGSARRKRPTLRDSRTDPRMTPNAEDRELWRESFKDIGSSIDPNDRNPDPSDQPIRTRELQASGNTPYPRAEDAEKPGRFVRDPYGETAGRRASIQPRQPSRPRVVHQLPPTPMPGPRTQVAQQQSQADQYGIAPLQRARRAIVPSEDQSEAGGE